MTHIKQTDIIHPRYIIAAKCHHQAAACSRIRVARLYFTSQHKDGHDQQEYLLTRYVNKLGVAMSSILAVQPAEEAGQLVLQEVCRESRKAEEKMIMRWYESIGGGGCVTEYLT